MSEQQENYKWNPEDKFEISGTEYGLFRHLVSSLLSNPEAEKIIFAYEASKVVESIFKKGIKEGKIKKEGSEIQEAEQVTSNIVELT